MTVQDLPAINATLNALSTVFIVAGISFIKSDMKQAHILSMLAALSTSTLFLASYLTYHALKHGIVTIFTYPGWPKTLYHCILWTHIPLAFLTLPLVFLTIIPAFQARYDRHRRIAKWTFPIWLYVWFPPTPIASRSRERGATLGSACVPPRLTSVGLCPCWRG